MLAHEIARIVQTDEEESDDVAEAGHQVQDWATSVKVKDGTFEGFDGEVGTIDAQAAKAVQVMISIFGRVLRSSWNIGKLKACSTSAASASKGLVSL